MHYHRLLLAHNAVRCFQSESEGSPTFSSCCAPPPYRFRSNVKLARSATVTAVPQVTAVHRKALNGKGIALNAGNRFPASHIPLSPTANPAAAPVDP
jgi:hypothetical protein